jgi:hypothetical protein
LLIDRGLHLTYCTNIHAADGWAGVFANLQRYAPALKARFAPSAPFGVGLRLSAREARELGTGDRLAEFRAFLDREGLYVALIEILSRLLPDGVDGGVSTAPLSYKAWMRNADSSAWRTIAEHVARVAEVLVRVRRERGAAIHLDIEPEPDCSIENTDESIDFFERWLLPVGAPALASALGVSAEDAARELREHIRLCFDCCHFAVEFEQPASALTRLERAGIRIGRVQLSSALGAVFLGRDRTQARAMAESLRPFADATYLHQVVARRRGTLQRYPDLGIALDSFSDDLPDEWRIHFHVPLFARDYEAFASTQDYVKAVIELARQSRFTSHLEIETYTWDVLPKGLKLDLLDSIAREYEWVLGQL